MTGSIAECAETPAVVQAAGPSPAIAYLFSRYPATSHTFLLNEVRSLRSLGFAINVASINPCDRPFSALDDAERTEAENTFYVKQAGVIGAIKATFAAIVRSPIGVARGFLFAARLGGNGVRFFYFLEALMVAEWMRRLGRSHIHTHFGGPVSSVAMILARTFPVTMSMTIHGPDEFYDVRGSYLREKLEAASFVFCISSFARSQVMMFSESAQWKKLIVAKLGVDSARFSSSSYVEKAGQLEIICVGRLVGAKGQRVLLGAFRQLIEEGCDVRLRLVGDGQARRSLETAVADMGLKERVVFEGAVSSNRVRELLGRAAIFALPSFAEGIPVALMEAMAMEVPCVTTTITGIPELIRNEIDGLLVPPSDEDQLAAALRRLVDSRELRVRLGAAGRLRVQQEFDLRTNTKRLGDLFACLL